MSTPTPLLLRQAADAVAAAQHHPAGALYVVGTPIGNLADITLRAIHLLSIVDAIACEDTRHSAPLLRQLGIEGKPLIALHQHNERDAASQVLVRLARGERVAYVTDAGTPAISDPGAALVAAAHAAGRRVVPIPGVSSAVAALSVAGDEAQAAAQAPFVFTGFLPARGADRKRALDLLASAPPTHVLFEAPHRIEALAVALAESCPARAVTVCRELTKQFETVARMPASDLPRWFAADANRARGEFVVVIHALVQSADADADEAAAAFEATLKTLLAALPLKQAVALTAELCGAPRNAVYERALALKQAD